eukprot:SAG11_NODE_1250_length_5389_cov_12.806994_8_plen_75_part_00
MSSAFGNLADWGLDDGGGVGASADAFAPPATVTDARVDGGGGGGIFGRRKKHVDLAFVSAPNRSVTTSVHSAPE